MNSANLFTPVALFLFVMSGLRTAEYPQSLAKFTTGKR